MRSSVEGKWRIWKLKRRLVEQCIVEKKSGGEWRWRLMETNDDEQYRGRGVGTEMSEDKWR